MKYFLRLFILLLLISCNSQTEKMTSSLRPFMNSKFPNASFEIVKTENLHKLIIADEENTVNENNLQSLMTETLGNFYWSFYKSSNIAASNSELLISYKSENLSWECEPYNLFELGEMYDLNEK